MTRLNQEIVRVLTRPDLKERLFDAGVIAGGSTPEEFAAIVQADIEKWGKVIRDAGIKLE
jgi:tripartite-type tricarboxylate transporter receptor subunit TctC